MGTYGFGQGFYGQYTTGGDIAVIVLFSAGVIVATLLSGNPSLAATSENVDLIVVDANVCRSVTFTG